MEFWPLAMSSSVWTHLRTGLITVHLVAIFLMALPNPSAGLQRSAWRDPTVQQEFAVWRSRLTWLGVEMTPKEFEEHLWDFASGFHGVRRAVLAPFDPYYRHFGTWQSWRMFVAPHRYPARLHIDIQEASGGWTPIYVARSEEYSWNQGQFNHERFRAALFRYGWPNYGSYHRQFSNWVADRVLSDFPEAQAVRVRFYKFRTLSPAETLRGDTVDGKYINARIVRRKDP